MNFNNDEDDEFIDLPTSFEIWSLGLVVAAVVLFTIHVLTRGG